MTDLPRPIKALASGSDFSTSPEEIREANAEMERRYGPLTCDCAYCPDIREGVGCCDPCGNPECVNR